MQVLREKLSEIDAQKLFAEYKLQPWGNKVLIEHQRPLTSQDVENYTEILLINFWQSLFSLPKNIFLHEDFLPKIEIKKEDDHVEASWEVMVFEKKGED